MNTVINNNNNNNVTEGPPPPPPQEVEVDVPNNNNNNFANGDAASSSLTQLYSSFQTHFATTAGDYIMVREAHETTTTATATTITTTPTAVPAAGVVAVFKSWLGGIASENTPGGGNSASPPTINDFIDAISILPRKVNSIAIDKSIDVAESFINRPSPTALPPPQKPGADDDTPPTPLAPPQTPDTPLPPPPEATSPVLLMESEEPEGSLIVDAAVDCYVEQHRKFVSKIPGIGNATSLSVYHILVHTIKEILEKMLSDLLAGDGDGGGVSSSSSILPKVYSLQALLVYFHSLLRECSVSAVSDPAVSTGTTTTTTTANGGGGARSLSLSSYATAAQPLDPFIDIRAILRAIDRLSSGTSDNDDDDGIAMSDATSSLLNPPIGALPEIEIGVLKEGGLGWGGPTPRVDSKTDLPILTPPHRGATKCVLIMAVHPFSWPASATFPRRQRRVPPSQRCRHYCC